MKSLIKVWKKLLVSVCAPTSANTHKLKVPGNQHIDRKWDQPFYGTSGIRPYAWRCIWDHCGNKGTCHPIFCSFWTKSKQMKNIDKARGTNTIFIKCIHVFWFWSADGIGLQGKIHDIASLILYMHPSFLLEPESNMLTDHGVPIKLFKFFLHLAALSGKVVAIINAEPNSRPSSENKKNVKKTCLELGWSK